MKQHVNFNVILFNVCSTMSCGYKHNNIKVSVDECTIRHKYIVLQQKQCQEMN